MVVTLSLHASSKEFTISMASIFGDGSAQFPHPTLPRGQMMSNFTKKYGCVKQLKLEKYISIKLLSRTLILE